MYSILLNPKCDKLCLALKGVAQDLVLSLLNPESSGQTRK